MKKIIKKTRKNNLNKAISNRRRTTKRKRTYKRLGHSRVKRIQRGSALISMPQLCFGTVQTNLETTLNKALEIGYRHIDGADLYGGEPYTTIIRDALKKYNRHEIWITWKSHNISSYSIQNIIAALDCGYIDLFLVHHGCGNEKIFKVFQEAQKSKLIQYYGVSNCEDIEEITKLKTDYNIYANQIQARPPNGNINSRTKYKHNDLIKDCNKIGVNVMLFGTISGIINALDNYIDNITVLFENMTNYNKYYIQKYIIPKTLEELEEVDNHKNKEDEKYRNVLMVSSTNTHNNKTLKENFVNLNLAISPPNPNSNPNPNPLLTPEKMIEVEVLLQSIILSNQS